MTSEEQEYHRKANNTRTLVLSVAMGISEWKRESAREMVPQYAFEMELINGPDPTVGTLARAMGVDRSNLWMCLGIYRGERRNKVRETLEEFLDLLPGGMTQVLALLEKL